MVSLPSLSNPLISEELGQNPTEFDPERDIECSYDEEQWLATELRWCKRRFFEAHNIRIALCCWNVDQKKPPGSLKDWLQLDKDPHLVVIGLQEVDMSANAMLVEETEMHKPWLEQVRKDLRATKGVDTMANCTTYHEVCYKQLVGLYMAVYVHHSLITPAVHFNNQPLSSESTGAVGGSFGNKGGIGFSCKIYDTSICIINAHLAAHMEAVDKRNKNAESVINHMKFAKSQAYRTWPAKPTDHDIILFFGDLNYRIVTTSISADRVRSLIGEGRWAELLIHDQLYKQVSRSDTVWSNWKMADVRTFPPTYKYDKGGDQYDSSEKRRVPAWTDRILWWCKAYQDEGNSCKEDINNSVQLEPQNFNHYPQLNVSDHKPIAGLITCKCGVENASAKYDLIDKIKKTIARGDESSLQYKMSTNTLTFGTVGLNKPETLKLTLENTGKDYLQYEIQADTSPSPLLKADWLFVSPSSDVLEVGGMAELTATVYINQTIVDRCFYEHRKTVLGNSSCSPNTTTSTTTPTTAEPPNLSISTTSATSTSTTVSTPTTANDPFAFLDGIADKPTVSSKAFEFELKLNLIIKLRCLPSTRNAYIEVNVNFRPTVIGVPLGRLIDLADSPIQEFYRSGGTNVEPFDKDSPATIPKELWYMVDHISANATTEELTQFTSDQWVLSRLPQNHVDVQCVQHHLDGNKGKIPDYFKAQCVGTLLLRWLEALDEPLIPYDLYHAALKSTTLSDPKKAAVEEVLNTSVMPNVHYNVFYYLVSFWRFWLLAANGAQKGPAKMNAEHLATAFAPVMLRPHPHATQSPYTQQLSETEVQKMQVSFVMLFIDGPD